MDDNKFSTADKVNLYKVDVERLSKYLPWLNNVNGGNLRQAVVPEQGGAGSLRVPVYDSTLLNFIKEFQKTNFLNKNYVYTYSRYRIKDYKDELKLIKNADINSMSVIGDILSMYVIKGMRKSMIWNQGIEYGVYECAVGKMKEIIEYWTRPGN